MKQIPIRSIQSIPNTSGKSEPFVIRELPVHLKGKDMNHGLHRHDFYFMLLIKKATGMHEIDFVSHVIKNNSVFFVRPGQVHVISLNRDAQGYLIQFNKEFFMRDATSGELIQKIATRNVCQLTDNSFDRLIPTLRAMVHEYSNKKENYYDIIRLNLHILFIELLRNRANKSNHAKTITGFAQEQLDKFLTLLEANVATHKQASQFADMLNTSAYQLNSVTKKLLGKTTSKLIDEYIVLEAKRQLLATSNQVNQISFQLGYEDVSYFIRFFKKHTGYSPESFRQNFK